MRILFQTYSLAFQSPGGGEQVLLELQRHLKKLGHSVDLYDPWQTEVLNYDCVHYFSCLETETWDDWPKHYPQVPLVVTPTLAFDSRPWLRTLHRSKQRVLQALQVASGENLQSRWGRYRIPDRWFPTTPTEGDLLSKMWGIAPARIQILPNGVDDAFFSAPSLEIPSIKPPDRFVLHIGRFDPVKNQLELIRALKGSKVHVVFVGGPVGDFQEYFNECQRLAQTDSSYFHFVGALPPKSPELKYLLKQAHCLVLPSRFETFGLTALEALASGTPVLMTAQTYSHGQLGNHVNYLSPEAWPQWRQEIEARFRNEKEKIGNQTINLIRQKYSWQEISKTLAQSYQDLCNSSKMPR